MPSDLHKNNKPKPRWILYLYVFLMKFIAWQGNRVVETQVPWNSTYSHSIAQKNWVLCTRFVRLLNSFKTLITNEIVWGIWLFWKKKIPLTHTNTMIVRVREALGLIYNLQKTTLNFGSMSRCYYFILFFLKKILMCSLINKKVFFFFFFWRTKKLLDIVKIPNILLHFLLLIFSISYLYTTLCINCHNIVWD